MSEIPTERRVPRFSISNMVAAVVVIVLGVGLVAGYLSLSGRLDSTKKALAATEAELGKQSNSGIASLQTSAAAEQKKLDGLTKRLVVTEKQLEMYEMCMPELLSQVTSLKGSVYIGSTGTVDVFPSPTQQVSKSCQPVLYGPRSTSPGE